MLKTGDKINWKKSQINHIRTSLNRLDAEGMASELGVAKSAVQEKINEIKESERISNLSSYAENKVTSNKLKARWMKHKIKRKIEGGM